MLVFRAEAYKLASIALTFPHELDMVELPHAPVEASHAIFNRSALYDPFFYSSYTMNDLYFSRVFFALVFETPE